MIYQGYKLVAKSFSWVGEWFESSALVVPIVAIVGGAILGIIPAINVLTGVALCFICFSIFDDCAKMKEDFTGTGDFMQKYRKAFGFMLITMLYWTAYVAWVGFTITYREKPYSAAYPCMVICIGIVFIGYVITAGRLFHKRMKWEKSVLPPELRG